MRFREENEKVPNSTDFDVQAFQSKVLWWVARLQKRREAELFYQQDKSYDIHKDSFQRLGCLATFVVKPFLTLQQHLSSSNYQKLQLDRERLTQSAQELLSRVEVKSSICTSLLGVSSDPVEIAGVITPILAPLARTRALSIPLEADLFAMCAVFIAGVGTSDFCAG